MKEKGSIYLRGCQRECVVWVTADTLAALFTLQYCQNLAIKVFLVESANHSEGTSQDPRQHTQGTRQLPQDACDVKDECLFPVDPSTFTFNFLVLEEKNCPSVLANCMLPAAVLNSEPPWCVAGLCSSLRFMLRQIVETYPQHHASHLLGFRGSCLQACAEVSVWTKFCEVEALMSLRKIVVNGCVRWQGGLEEVVSKLEEVKIKDSVEKGGGKVEKSESRLKESEIKVDKAECRVEKVRDSVEEARGRVDVTADLVRYERHLQRPPLLHNALKMKHQYIRDTVQDKDERDRLLRLPISQLPDLEHTFAEGLKMTLADVLLFVSFHIILTNLQSYVTLDNVIPLVLKWHKVILANEYVKKALPVLSNSLAQFCSEVNPDGPLEAVIPSVPDESIYKSDPERYKPRWRSFTHQEDINAVLDVLRGAEVELGYSDHPAQNISLPWPSLPPSVNPKEGHLPPSRLERKCQQLENVVAAVECVVRDGDAIVDFCAGGGHVGIILAYRLPQCKVLLVENKEESLLRAKERVNTLGLKNVVFVQCNLDYFQGSFQVGVSLHACGVATDLMMLKCVEQRAAFVCSPCCYGGVQANHVLAYPRSQTYHDLPFTLDQYLTLGHAADQTHDDNNPKTSQGQQCMRLVDSDRLVAAQEVGYSVSLTLMHPPHCSPKNHLLIGVVPS